MENTITLRGREYTLLPPDSRLVIELANLVQEIAKGVIRQPEYEYRVAHIVTSIIPGIPHQLASYTETETRDGDIKRLWTMTLFVEEIAEISGRSVIASLLSQKDRLKELDQSDSRVKTKLGAINNEVANIQSKLKDLKTEILTAIGSREDLDLKEIVAPLNSVDNAQEQKIEQLRTQLAQLQQDQL